MPVIFPNRIARWRKTQVKVLVYRVYLDPSLIIAFVIDKSSFRPRQVQV